MLAQNYAWVNGSTGIASGNTMAMDQWNRFFVAGAFVPDVSVPMFTLPNSIPGTTSIIPPGGERCDGYVARYHKETGQPTGSGDFAILRPSFGFNNPNDGFLTIKKMEVDRNGFIHVMGEFRGDNIEILEFNGNPQSFLINSTGASVAHKKVFIATLDSNFVGYSCHLIYNEDHDVHMGDLAIGDYDVDKSIFYTLAFRGEFLITEQFGVGLPPIAPWDNLFHVDADYEIFVGQINLNTYQLMNGVVIDGPGDDYPAELASGYQGYLADESALFLSGTFSDSIYFNDPVLGMTGHQSNGDYDIFSVKFTNFNLSSQLACVAGGPYKDQALCIGDQGYLVGGFMTDSASFGSAGIAGVYGLSPFSGYSLGNRKEVGFVAQADYDNHDWIWFQEIEDAVYDGQVNTLAQNQCDEFYIGFERGMHSVALSLPIPSEHIFLDNHLFYYAYFSSTDHLYYSRLQKWLNNGTGASQIWDKDFYVPLSTAYDAMHIKANFIKDIAVYSDQMSNDSVDVIVTGRFGQKIAFPWVTKVGADTLFDGNVAPSSHGQTGMFVFGLDENPMLDTAYYQLCLTDSAIELYCPIMALSSGMPTYDTSAIEYTYLGAGIIDSSGLFDPYVAGIGTHEIIVIGNYYGCNALTQGRVFVTVYEDTLPRQPLSTHNNWAAGMAAEARLHTQMFDSLGQVYNTYYLAGNYQDTIQFEGVDGNMIVLTTPNNTPSGYVVAYGPCGALWATNFVSDGSGGYVEDMILNDSANRLYVTGAIDGPIALIETNTPSALTTSSNGISFSSNFVQKGFVAELDPSTGQVYKMFLCGNGLNESSRFHGLDIAEDSLIFVVGEYYGSLSANTPDVPPTSVGYDVLVCILDTLNFEAYSFEYMTGGGPDHGDAIDVVKIDEGVYGYYYTGYLSPGAVTLQHPNAKPSASFTISLGNQKELFIANGTASWWSGYALVGDIASVMESPGNQVPMDIAIGGVTDIYPFGNNNLFVSGWYDFRFDTWTFENGYAYNDYHVFGSGIGQDAFLMSIDLKLEIQWFRQEGSPFTSNETADALDFKGKYGYVTGKYKGTPTAAGGSLLLDGLPTQPVSGNFVVKFTPSGNRVDTTFTIGAAFTGTTESTDIVLKDTFAVLSGTIDFNQGQSVDFYKYNSSVPFNTLTQVSSVSDAYLARVKYSSSALGYNKMEETEPTSRLSENISIYPNPSNGLYNIQMNGVNYNRLRVLNLLGEIVLEKTLNSQVEIIQIDHANGVYFFEFSNEIEREIHKVQLVK